MPELYVTHQSTVYQYLIASSPDALGDIREPSGQRTLWLDWQMITCFFEMADSAQLRTVTISLRYGPVPKTQNSSALTHAFHSNFAES